MFDSQSILLNTTLIYTLIAIFSLAIGSLLNVIIYRLPLMMKADWLAECQCLLGQAPSIEPPMVNLFFPRSFCTACKKTITAFHNIPVLSYLFLRGRCGHCQHPISLRYPLIELSSALLAMFAYQHFGFTLVFLFALLFIWLLICLFFIDIDHQLLPDTLTISLLWLGLIANTQSLFTSLPNAVYSACGAYLFLWLFIKLFYLITGKIGMGHGDFKLFAAFGAWFGWTQLPLILVLASITGAITGLIYLKRSKQTHDTPIPFGPFLCTAGFIALFWGSSIFSWYIGMYL